MVHAAWWIMIIYYNPAECVMIGMRHHMPAVAVTHAVQCAFMCERMTWLIECHKLIRLAIVGAMQCHSILQVKNISFSFIRRRSMNTACVRVSKWLRWISCKFPKLNWIVCHNCVWRVMFASYLFVIWLNITSNGTWHSLALCTTVKCSIPLFSN